MARKRKSLSKKTRFEVFKRDKFTCQYCGAKAPDVVLHCDHLIPVCNGGDSHITNLVTSCEDCNQGKGARELSDDSIVLKQREQLEASAEKIEQIEMIASWRNDVKEAEDLMIEKLCEEFSNQYPGIYVKDLGKKHLKKLLKKFGFEECLNAIVIAGETYTRDTQDETASSIGFSKLGGILHIRSLGKSDPEAARPYYIRGIRRRLGHVNERIVISLITDAHNAGADYDELEMIAKHAKSWTEFRETLEAIIRGGYGDTSF